MSYPLIPSPKEFFCVAVFTRPFEKHSLPSSVPSPPFLESSIDRHEKLDHVALTSVFFSSVHHFLLLSLLFFFLTFPLTRCEFPDPVMITISSSRTRGLLSLLLPSGPSLALVG